MITKKMILESNKEIYLLGLEKNGIFNNKLKSILIRKFLNSSMFLEISQYYLDKWNKVMKYDPKTRDFEELYFTKKNTPLKKTITKTKKKQIESEVCSICLDAHTYKNVIQINCSHVFGKSCFQKLSVVRKRKHFVVKCPLCRTECTKYSLFKLK
jgi:hypothetical protein